MNASGLDGAAVRLAATYLPLAGAALAIMWRRPSRRVWGACLLATVWNVSGLFALNVVAQQVGWWSFGTHAATSAGVPVDLWLGWALLWGALPLLVVPRRAVASAPVLVLIDLVAMPLANPLVHLGDQWLVGEFVGVVTCLVPGLLLGMWTARDEHVAVRASMQFLTFTALVFYVLPSAVFALVGGSWSTLIHRPRWQLILSGVLLAPVAAVALTAVVEFARAGGTPLPLDPPKHLVVTGPYAYLANPMQTGATLLLLAWGVLLGSASICLMAAVAAALSAGLAGWSEDGELRERFGEAWLDYRRAVHLWRPNWKPYVNEAATVFVAQGCDPCSQVGDFLRSRQSVGLAVSAAEDHPSSLRRITYERGSLRDSGIGAVARSMEHVNLAWALVGWLVRLPLVRHVVQLINDAVGGDPRDLAGWTVGPADKAKNGST